LSPLSIGLSGGYCAGKNAAAAFLAQEGFEVLDVDRLGHQATENRQADIVGLFGAGILGADGRIDRRKLASLAFSDPGALRRLEELIHPEANALAEAWMAENRGKNLCLNAALLHLMPAIGRLDFIIEVRAPLGLRLRRARSRDGVRTLEALRRIRAQRGFGAKLRAAGVPVIRLRNAGGLPELREALRLALERGKAL
jgi:dephospho-CoA kinase